MSNGDLINIWALSSRARPNRSVDNAYEALRANNYGELGTAPFTGFRQNLSDEGSYFSWHNVTIDQTTTLAGHAAPVLVDADVTMTKPFIFMRNGATAASGRRSYLDFIEIEVITAGANGTADCWSAQLDTGATRYSSGTLETFTATTGLCNPNMQSTAAPDLVVQGGPCVVGAESASVRYLGHGQFRPVIAITGDKYVFRFGGDAEGATSVVVGANTHHVVNLGPVVLGPTDQFLLALYAPSQSAAGVYKVRGGHWER